MRYPEPDIQVATFVEVHPILQRHFATDADVSHVVGDRVFAGELPDKASLPAIRFRFPQMSGLTQPVPYWWTHTGQVDCYADSEKGADDLTNRVMRSLLRLQQSSHLEGVIGTVSAWEVESAMDFSRTPPKPKRIVSVTLTARRKS